MKRKVKRPFDNEQFRKGYVAGIFAAEKELNTELLHFAEKAHKIMSEGTFPDYGVKINFKDSNNTITTNLDMKTEEKAKRYDEALEWMRKVYPTLTGAAKEDAEHYFPELKESEDEKMIGVIRLALTDVPEERFTTEGTSLSEVFAWIEKQKEQKPIKMEVHEVGKGTTICGQDYKCKKDYQEGICRYIKDVIYHCSRDGYLNDQNGISWSCTPEWFNEYIYTNSEWADEEKKDFIGGQFSNFIQCKLSFDRFKEGEHYWLEYVGDDMYVGRSDNILNQKFHITPRQLYTLFSQQLDVNEDEQKPVEDWREKRKEECPFRRNLDNNLYGCERYADVISECTGACSWVVDYPKLKEIQDKKEQKPAEWSKEDRDRVAQYLHDRDGGMLWSKATEITSDILDILRPQPYMH